MPQADGKGFDETSNSSENTHISETGGAESGAVIAEFDTVAPNLEKILQFLTSLPEETRRAIAAALQDVPAEAESVGNHEDAGCCENHGR